MPSYRGIQRKWSRMTSGKRHLVENVTSANALSISESGKVLTNLGASASVTHTLPATPEAGSCYTFIVAASYPLVITANTASGIYFHGVKGANNGSLVCGLIGSQIKIVADNEKDWHVIHEDGPWTANTAIGSLLQYAPLQRCLTDPSFGYGFMDDFMRMDTALTTENHDGYLYYGDTGVTFTCLTTKDEVGGVFEITANDDDNDQGVIGLGPNATANYFKLADTASKPFWFEARLKVSVITDAKHSMFIGLCEEGLVADNAILTDNTGALTDKDFAGWQILNGDGNAVVGRHRIEGGADTAVTGADEAIVANTYFNLGLYANATTCYWFFNGVSQGSVAHSAATFPGGEEMTIVLATKSMDTALCTTHMDWWWGCQLR